jgi:hypothetical protein
MGILRATADFGRVTGNPEVISSPAGLVPLNALTMIERHRPAVDPRLRQHVRFHGTKRHTTIRRWAGACCGAKRTRNSINPCLITMFKSSSPPTTGDTHTYARRWFLTHSMARAGSNLCGNATIRFATDHTFSGGKLRLAILRHVNGIQFFDKPLLRHSRT